MYKWLKAKGGIEPPWVDLQSTALPIMLFSQKRQKGYYENITLYSTLFFRSTTIMGHWCNIYYFINR